ncbi:glycosyltransferase family 1 protein [Anabaena azotica]|uniref:glycosyltransferase family 1 protein n=1 Tax=Anabaena azotica TaxID=197653 RepID=UPI0039A4F9BF
MSNLDQVTVIVPRLPPAIDGVGDYGLNLAQQMCQDFGVISEFLIGDKNWSGQDFIAGFPVRQVGIQSEADLLELLPHDQNSDQIVLLHYVGYGYARRGCPVWLVAGLERWRKGGNNRRLVTMFHEIYAFGAIWTSQFWTSPLQRNLAGRLVRLSDRCITSKQGYAEIISNFSKGKHSDIPTLPVFSTVGEPESLPLLSERSRRLVVFGGTGTRSRVYQDSQLALQRTCEELEIEEIFDIGPPLDLEISAINNIPVTCLGIKSASEISSILSTSLVGFFNYPLAYLTKSTIFAAYCAHKLLPIGIWYEGQDVDGLVAGKNYWLGDRYQQQMNISDGQIVAENAYNWYAKHSLSAQAHTFMNYIRF